MAQPPTVPLSKLPVSRPISVELLPSQTAPAATAPPPSKPPSSVLGHPPYIEMIVSAIRALKERKGSSKKAIAKYIDSAYTNLPPSHSALLTHHLKRLKKSGVLLTVKNSYKLPKPSKLSGQAPDGAPTKRGRGRPPKPKVAMPAGTGLPEKRGRGRPPKVPKPKQVSAAASSGPVSQKRGRGRPPKPKAGGVVVRPDGAAVPVVVPRPRGRPRKNASASPAGDGGGGELVLIPASESSEAVIVPPVIVSLGRPRGRPPKVGGPSKPKRVPATGRPRGRPPKVGGPAKPKSVSSTGRPRGRPRKVPVAAAVAE